MTIKNNIYYTIAVAKASGHAPRFWGGYHNIAWRNLRSQRRRGAQGLDEVVAENIRAMWDRCRPRDVYDVVDLFIMRDATDS